MYITSNNYAHHANLIYSQTIAQQEVKDLDMKNKEIVNSTSNELFQAVTYKLLNFEIRNESVIYSDTDYVLNLFSILKKYKDLQNITLITSQSDTGITDKLYDKKPACITKWFSSNVEIEKSGLIPIPLGISNGFSKKNITENNLPSIPKKINTDNKETSMYLNFNINTNIKERGTLYEMFANEAWCNIENISSNNNHYIEKIKQNLFVLCPWGNGIETHRLWETLYLGSIPITKYHPTHKNYKDLPIVFVDSYEDINLELLMNFTENLKTTDFNLKKINIKYWRGLIDDSVINAGSNANEIISIEETNVSVIYNRYMNIITKTFDSKLKIIKFYLCKLLKLKKLLSG